jgi:putative transposase
MELSGRWPIRSLCDAMSISRSGYYKWKARLSNPCPRVKKRMSDILLFEDCHRRFPSHGYRWLNAKIRMDTGLVVSDQYAHRCCKFAGIKSKSKHYAYKKAGEPKKIYPNAVMASVKVDGPLQVVVSDMTAFWANKAYWELTLYMDLWNNEIVGYGLSSRRGDRDTYFDGLQMVAERKNKIDGLGLILHTDQGSVYASKSFNELLPQYHITHSMSRAGTPTDNGAMEAINGWAKIEMFVDFDVGHCEDVPAFIERYIQFFNEERPSAALGYLTPKAYRELAAQGKQVPCKPSKIKYEKKQKKIMESKVEK